MDLCGRWDRANSGSGCFGLLRGKRKKPEEPGALPDVVFEKTASPMELAEDSERRAPGGSKGSLYFLGGVDSEDSGIEGGSSNDMVYWLPDGCARSDIDFLPSFFGRLKLFLASLGRSLERRMRLVSFRRDGFFWG